MVAAVTKTSPWHLYSKSGVNATLTVTRLYSSYPNMMGFTRIMEGLQIKDGPQGDKRAR